ELGDPADVRLDGLDVVVSEDTSWIPARRELRDARERAAAALAAAGARVRHVPLPTMRRALELYLTALQSGATRGFRQLLEEESGAAERLALRRLGWGAARRRGPHTMPTVILLATESLFARTPPSRTRRALA